MKSVRILAPAKVNLGLAILGKRPDGYHNIDTILAMIDLFDEITLTPRSDEIISISGMDDVPLESNLMTKAARIWAEIVENDSGWHIDIVKQIPSPAGIGGGSSDAAAVLTALNDLHQRPVSPQQLHELAATLGADCPFFLGSPCSRATGIGTDLREVASPKHWVVLAIPQITQTSKTAALYGSLTSQDYKRSSEIGAVEEAILAGDILFRHLPNSFLTPALAAFPMLDQVRQRMIEIAGTAHLSGAGPALFAIAASESQAQSWATMIRKEVPESVEVLTAAFLQSRPQLEFLA